jgi:tetratricopeptide (TPR) repeat protein
MKQLALVVVLLGSSMSAAFAAGPASPATTAAPATSDAMVPPPLPAAAVPPVGAKPSPFVPLSQQTGKPGEARVSEAREHFNRGVSYFKDGSLEAALAEFTRANELAPSYRLHFNIAQVQYELRNYVEAERSFQRYLAEADAELPADRRTLVEGELRKLDRLVAQFSVKTSVPGVQIAIDGVPAGMVAQDNMVLVNTNPGVRRVSASKDGFVPASLVVTVTPGERRRLVFELAPLVVAQAGGSSLGLAGGSASPEKPRTKTVVSAATAAGLLVATGVFALLARNANTEFEHQLNRVPNDRANVDDARDRLSRYATIADVLAVGAAMATGVSIYFAFTEGSEPERRYAARPSGVQIGWSGKF